MLQLVDQVMAVKHMRAPLGLTEEKTVGGVEVVKETNRNSVEQGRLKFIVIMNLTLHTLSNNF